MEIKLDGFVNAELKEYLLSQEGIIDVDINNDGYFVKLNINFNEKTNPIIIMKYIELFEEYQYSNLIEFDKGDNQETKTLKYVADDVCCEYCYMGIVMNLFENDNIKSVKSNFDISDPAFNIEFLIEYSGKYSEQELIQYIEEII